MTAHVYAEFTGRHVTAGRVVACFGDPITCLQARGARADAGVVMLQHGRDVFSVVYGLERNENLTYGEAAASFGNCVMHYQSCESIIDNRD